MHIKPNLDKICKKLCNGCMAKKKKSIHKQYHFFFHTRSGFYSLVATAVVLGFGAIILWG